MMDWDKAVALADRLNGEDDDDWHYIVEAKPWGGQVMAEVVVFDETWARLGVL